MMHEEVHDRAGQEEKERQCAQHVHSVLGEQVVARHYREAAENEFGEAGHLSAAMKFML
ncbi:hypothetical protein GGQ88_003319 [Novosphingobium hassiacum]|uniref:Uncharacterized protein n=1 Tax=Novosphingobium hassiacum TaxID=173676 RepID=A0A7W6EXF8_9SPHN|nr:hypothetical protein [Novosphingobium hassiacum]MBB3862025.1 hypothetical protein [Novosphingobium hassiacum]